MVRLHAVARTTLLPRTLQSQKGNTAGTDPYCFARSSATYVPLPNYKQHGNSDRRLIVLLATRPSHMELRPILGHASVTICTHSEHLTEHASRTRERRTYRYCFSPSAHCS